MQDSLTDKTAKDYLVTFSIRVAAETKRRYDIINGYKDGLPEEVRKAIAEVVDFHYQRLQDELSKSA